MSIKRILAAAAASVVAVSAMAVVASAADYETTYTYDANATDIFFDADGGRIAQIQVGHVTAVEFTAEYTTSDGTTGFATIVSDWGNGESAEGAVTVKGAWNGANVLLPEGVEEDGTTIKFTGKVTEDDLAAGVEGSGADCQIMVIGVNAINDRVLVKEAEGAAPTDPEPAPADPEPAPADPEPAPTANNVDTGVEGVAAVLGVAAVAAGAMIVAKKRK